MSLVPIYTPQFTPFAIYRDGEIRIVYADRDRQMISMTLDPMQAVDFERSLLHAREQQLKERERQEVERVVFRATG